ncbi:MAG: hypothetical protein Aurels2KO_10760 [Aureliella sp.]
MLLRLTALLCILVPSANLHADIIPAGLVFGGQYEFDTSSGASPFASQSGSIFSRVAGVDSTTVFSDGAVVSGVNPLSAVFTMHGGGVVGTGDGFGGTSLAQATLGGVFRTDTDQTTVPFVVINASATAYRISMSLTYDHTVSTTGSDTGVRSDIEVNRDGNALIAREIMSDTFVGNNVNGVDVAGFGGVVSDSGLVVYEFVLPSGGSTAFDLDFTTENGLVVDDAITSSQSSYFFSIDNVQAVPEPGCLLLLSLTASCAAFRRRA